MRKHMHVHINIFTQMHPVFRIAQNMLIPTNHKESVTAESQLIRNIDLVI